MDIDVSIFFARLWGSFFVIFGSLFILTRFLGELIDKTEDRFFVIATGYNTLLMGLVTVILHNIWVLDWRIVITVLGWSTLIKGILKIGFPEFIHKQAQTFKERKRLEGGILVLFGGWLIWMSFVG